MFICNLLLFPPLFFSSNHPKISFLPLCIYKNGQKNRAKTGRFSLQFLPSNHNILWLNPSISSLFHNTASEPLTQHVSYVRTDPPAAPSAAHSHPRTESSDPSRALPGRNIRMKHVRLRLPALLFVELRKNLLRLSHEKRGICNPI